MGFWPKVGLAVIGAFVLFLALASWPAIKVAPPGERIAKACQRSYPFDDVLRQECIGKLTVAELVGEQRPGIARAAKEAGVKID